MSRLNELVRSFVSEESSSLVEALFDALTPNEQHAFYADVMAHREIIEEMRAALREAETASAPLGEVKVQSVGTEKESVEVCASP